MAVQATKIVSVEQITISVPIGTQLKITDIPSILYVNYNGSPYHGYITFSESDKRKLLVLNPSTGSTPTSGTTVTGVPVPIDVAADGTITNIPTDIQQEVLLKGGLKNAVVSHTGGDGTAGTAVTITSYEPLVFYISILVGGIDWRPASRFPSDIDLLDHLDGYMKEPVTSSDIPAIDAYQYLISLQTRSQAEDYQLESLKQSLAKKMILARDINYVMACVLAVERAYFDLLERLKRLELRVGYIEDTWLPEVEGRVVTLEVNMKNVWDNLLQNWRFTHDGLINAREDAYWRVYHALKHYGAEPSVGWERVPMFGSGSSTGSSSDSIDLKTGGNVNYRRTIINPDTGENDKNVPITSVNPQELGYPSINYGADRTYPIMNIAGFYNLRAFNGGNWGGNVNISPNTRSGDVNVNLSEYFHNIIVHGTGGGGVGIITNEQIGFYRSQSMEDIQHPFMGVFKVRGSSGSARLHLNNGSGMVEAVGGRTFFGSGAAGEDGAGFASVSTSGASTRQNHAVINGERTHIALIKDDSYINFSSNNAGCNYSIMNMRRNAYVGNGSTAMIIEREFNGRYAGIGIDGDGLHLYGLAQKTLDELKKYLIDGGCGGEGITIPEVPPPDQPKGKVSVSSTCGSASVDNTAEVDIGTQVTLSFNPSSGKTFKGWFANGVLQSTSNPWTYSVQAGANEFDARCEDTVVPPSPFFTGECFQVRPTNSGGFATDCSGSYGNVSWKDFLTSFYSSKGIALTADLAYAIVYGSGSCYNGVFWFNKLGQGASVSGKYGKTDCSAEAGHAAVCQLPKNKPDFVSWWNDGKLWTVGGQPFCYSLPMINPTAALPTMSSLTMGYSSPDATPEREDIMAKFNITDTNFSLENFIKETNYYNINEDEDVDTVNIIKYTYDPRAGNGDRNCNCSDNNSTRPVNEEVMLGEIKTMLFNSFGNRSATSDCGCNQKRINSLIQAAAETLPIEKVSTIVTASASAEDCADAIAAALAEHGIGVPEEEDCDIGPGLRKSSIASRIGECVAGFDTYEKQFRGSANPIKD